MAGSLRNVTGSKRADEPYATLAERTYVMGIPTVYIVGTERLALVPEYLNLGSVVVVAPDRDTLKRWGREQDQHSDGLSVPNGIVEGATVVDLAGRRIVSDGATLPLSDLEYRVLSALLDPPGRAISFRELRTRGWGDGAEVSADVYSVRALVQRLRAKLEVARADVRIEAVRGFGFRADLSSGLVRGASRTRRGQPPGVMAALADARTSRGDAYGGGSA